MHEVRSQTPDERLRFLELVRVYVYQPSWTPAMGAMLVNGIQPPPGCVEIPESASQLEAPVKMATQSQFLYANVVLKRWRDDVEDDEDMPQGNDVEPMKFLLWCEEHRWVQPPEKLLEFLRHINLDMRQFTQHPDDEIDMLRKLVGAKAWGLLDPQHSRATSPPEPKETKRVDDQVVISDSASASSDQSRESTQDGLKAIDVTAPIHADQSSTPTSDVLEPKPPPGIDRFPASGEIADAFAGVLNKNKDQWGAMLKDPPNWLKPARIKKGNRGRDDATWDPSKIAIGLLHGARVEVPLNRRGKDRYETVKTSLLRLDGIFRTKLPAWDLAWQSIRETLESDDS